MSVAQVEISAPFDSITADKIACSELSLLLKSCSQELFFTMQENERLTARLQNAQAENAVSDNLSIAELKLVLTHRTNRYWIENMLKRDKNSNDFVQRRKMIFMMKWSGVICNFKSWRCRYLLRKLARSSPKSELIWIDHLNSLTSQRCPTKVPMCNPRHHL